MRKNKKESINTKQIIISLFILAVIIILAYFIEENNYNSNNIQASTNIFGKISYSSLQDIPEYNGEIRVMINENKQYFSKARLYYKIF